MLEGESFESCDEFRTFFKRKAVSCSLDFQERDAAFPLRIRKVALFRHEFVF